MIGVGVGYPISIPTSGANRVGTNPPSRPVPTRSLGIALRFDQIIQSQIVKAVEALVATLGLGAAR